MTMTKEQHQQLMEEGEALLTRHREELKAFGKKVGLEVVGSLESVALTEDRIVVSASDSSYPCLCAMIASMVVCATEAIGDVSISDMLKEIKKHAEYKASKSPELRYKKELRCK